MPGSGGTSCSDPGSKLLAIQRSPRLSIAIFPGPKKIDSDSSAAPKCSKYRSQESRWEISALSVGYMAGADSASSKSYHASLAGLCPMEMRASRLVWFDGLSSEDVRFKSIVRNAGLEIASALRLASKLSR